MPLIGCKEKSYASGFTTITPYPALRVGTNKARIYEGVLMLEEGFDRGTNRSKHRNERGQQRQRVGA